MLANLYIQSNLAIGVEMETIKNGDIIRVRYTGWKKANNEVFDSNDKPDAQPMEMIVGAKEFIAGFNEALIGMQVGETKTVDIPKIKAYGDRNPNLMACVPMNQLFSGGIIPKVGKILMLRNPLGGIMPGLVTEIRGNDVVIDMNPPMAGHDLVFRIKVEELVKKGSGHATD